MGHPEIAYIVSRWGEPTQTFVRREAEGVAALGADVIAVSLKRPGAAGSTVRSTHLTPAAVLVGLARTTVRHPGPVARVLKTVITRSALRNVVPQLVAAAVGLAWAGRPEATRRSLHAHFGWVAVTAAWAAAQVTGARFSVVLHAFELHGRRYQDRFTEVPIRSADAVFVISAADRAIASKRWGIEATVIRMGVPGGWLADAPDPMVGRDRVVSVGSLVPKKGHDVLLRAIAECPVRYRLEIIGAGPLEASLRDQCRRLGLEARVEFVGLLGEEEVRRRLRSAWVVALAARVDTSGDQDGVPVALMEAMAVGSPVVSTRVGAIAELVEGAGLLVPPEDSAAFAGALGSLHDPEARARWARAGIARVRDGWTIEASAQVVFDAHRSIDG